MTVFAPIIPFGVEVALRGKSIVPDTVVLTPSAVIQQAPTYKKMYVSGPRPKNIFINGDVGDTDRSSSLEFILEAAEKVHATHIILPDVAHDSNATVVLAGTCMKKLKRQKSFKGKIIAVAQGKDFADYVDCANSLVDVGIDGLGIPRNIEDVDRLRATYVFAMRGLGVPVHMLGMSNDLDEDLYCCSLPGVESFSSAMPIWLGQSEKLLRVPWAHDTRTFGDRPKNFFFSDKITTEMVANIFIMSSWLKGGLPCAS